MDPMLAKLNLRAARYAWVLGAPPEAMRLLAALEEVTEGTADPDAEGPFDFALMFLRSCADVPLAAARTARLADDAVFWCAYPKKASRRLASDLSRDKGFQPLGNLGFEPVRMVSLDADWSALRFRKVEFIRTLGRGSAISASGRARIALRDEST